LTEQQNGKNHYIKCNYCSSLFFSKADLERHMAAFGQNPESHEQYYKRTHNRLEHGYGSDE
jgi:hypothetical protein